MTKTITAMIVAVSGVSIARLGQGVMTTDWDGLWAGVAVASILAGVAITASGPIHRCLAPVTRKPGVS